MQNGRYPIRSICVYCGSGCGTNPAYLKSAIEFGRILAENDVRLVYGGGANGLMGGIARSVLAHGGKVTGVIPGSLVELEGLIDEVEKIIVRDMHERKMQMFKRADAFVAFPGELGTLEELLEQLTWAAIGHHNKPIVIANVCRYWDGFLDLIDHMRDKEFIRPKIEVDLLVAEEVDQILPLIGAMTVNDSLEHNDMTNAAIAENF